MNRKLSGSRVANTLIITALIIVPLMYAGLLTWAYKAPIDRIGRMKAAVVNLDRAAVAKFPTGEKRLQLGKDLEDRLYAADAPGFGWQKADLQEAEDGLANGKYRAMLIIPNNLSANAAKLADPTDTTVKPSVIKLQTDDAVNYLAGTMATSVAKALESTASESGSKEYIDHLLMAFEPIHAGIDQGVSGAKQLAEGNQKLANGAGTASAGGDKLAAGTDQAVKGIGVLSNGAHKLKTGTDTLVVGVRALQNGAAQLSDGSVKLANGAKALVGGSGELSKGLDKYTKGAQAIAAGSSQFAAAFKDHDQQPGLLTGAQKVNGGAKQLLEVARKADAGIDQLHSGAQKMQAGMAKAKAGADGLAAGSKQLAAMLSPADGKTTIKDGTEQMAGFAKQLAQVCEAFKADPVCVGIKAKLGPEGFEGLVAQAQALNEGVSAAAQGAQQLAGGAQQLAAGLTPGQDASSPSLADAVNQVLAATTATGKAQTLKDATQGMAGGLTQLAAGSDQLATGLSVASSKAEQLSAGANQLTKNSPLLIGGLNKLQGGLLQLQDGTQKGAAGAHKLADGTNKLADGSSKLANGVDQLNGGVGKLADGAGQLDAGAHKLAGGLHKLADGSDRAADGAKQLATGLADGAQKLPNITDAEAAKVSAVAAGPVKVDQTRLHGVYDNGIGFAPFFMGLSLWIGGIAVFLIFPALDLRRSPEEAFFICGLRSLGTAVIFGMAQAALVILGLTWLLDLNAVHFWPLLLIAILSSITFVSVNQACVAALGFRGRFVSVVLLCLQITTAGATFPIETTDGFLRFVHPLLPLTYTIKAFRSLIAGGSQSMVPVVLMLLGWMIVAWLITIWAAYRRTGNRPMPFDPALAFPGYGGAPHKTVSDVLAEDAATVQIGSNAENTVPLSTTAG